MKLSISLGEPNASEEALKNIAILYVEIEEAE